MSTHPLIHIKSRRIQISTYDKILDVANIYIQKFGFEGFSYSDLAQELGIKKASIHYHFPNKMDLGLAYCQLKREALIQLDQRMSSHTTIQEKISDYLAAFAICAEQNMMCGIYAMSSDSALFSPVLQDQINDVVQTELNLLEKAFSETQATLPCPLNHLEPKALAVMVNSTVKGALMLNRMFKDPQQYTQTTTALLKMLG
ncbi:MULTISPECIES: TetR/AcrR family transcriptional regulator [unclassified Acinetobacter]|uniref:TetR/AcrR family transcriptional regulator n=1 Tax=unclassified Acinetobacter TaxID=196816 RepID=UPI002934DDFC|nr:MULTISPECIES: TetR/AcrR family transcriptional regulator [unclassified Acinetobacter]WOE30608.1 TetR/AcrR family transcriptional regulator [Acinetobacter sp. SAAs470]WOE38800.1 TetR/AcrR family transcriptional regulator [Acinetobacter sp. SAAs474]